MSQNHRLPQILNLEGIEIIDKGGEYWFTAEQIGRMLGYASRDEVNRLYQRNILELQDFSTTVKLTVEGNLREHRIFSEEALYILTMLAQTPLARTIRPKIARILKSHRQKTLETAVAEAWKKSTLAFGSLTDVERRNLAETSRYLGLGLRETEISKLLSLSRRTVGRIRAKIADMGGPAIVVSALAANKKGKKLQNAAQPGRIN